MSQLTTQQNNTDSSDKSSQPAPSPAASTPPDCIFCQIAQGTLPSQIIFENDHFVAFPDLHPAAPKHFLIIPKQHYATLEEVALEDSQLMAALLRTVRQVAKQEGIADNYQLKANVGRQVQVIHHLHFHLLGGWPADEIPQ